MNPPFSRHYRLQEADGIFIAIPLHGPFHNGSGG